MKTESIRRWAALAVGALLLAGTTVVITRSALAEQDRAQDPAQPQIQQPPPPGGGFGQGGLRPGGPGFQPGGPGFGPGFGPMMGGSASITATATAVYVLRGNTLYAFDARTLRLAAKAELPAPEFGPAGPGGPPGPGGPGRGGPGGAPPRGGGGTGRGQ